MVNCFSISITIYGKNAFFNNKQSKLLYNLYNWLLYNLNNWLLYKKKKKLKRTLSNWVLELQNNKSRDYLFSACLETQNHFDVCGLNVITLSNLY